MKWWLSAAAATWGLCWLARPLLQRSGVIDRPNARSSHSEPTIRGGGVGIVACWIIFAVSGWSAVAPAQELAWLLSLGLVLATVSFVDDVRPVPAVVRLVVHTALAVGSLMALGMTGLPIAALLLGFLWVCGYTNAFNFMDGINGLAAMQAVITAAGTALIAVLAGARPDAPVVWLSLVVSGSAAGFIPHNFPRAWMFMGDVSSAALGFLLAALALWTARDHGWDLLLPLGLLHANFVVDTGVTLLRRILRRARLHEAHREHFYKRLVQAGWSHPRVTLIEMGLQLCVLALAVGTIHADVSSRVLATCAGLGLWLGFFTLAERLFRRASVQAPR